MYGIYPLDFKLSSYNDQRNRAVRLFIIVNKQFQLMDFSNFINKITRFNRSSIILLI